MVSYLFKEDERITQIGGAINVWKRDELSLTAKELERWAKGSTIDDTNNKTNNNNDNINKWFRFVNDVCDEYKKTTTFVMAEQISTDH